MAIVYEFNYTGSEQSITLKPGKYKFECWGASGIAFPGTSYSKGGYTYGELALKKETTLFIYVGGGGLDHKKDVFAFNGGGLSSGQGGGGATDIRLIGGDWNNEQGLLSRIIVAGGSGGSYSETPGGVGGGFEGGNGSASSDNRKNLYTPGAGQCYGGRGYKDCFSGVFGCGAGSVLGLSDSDYAYNSGGGGWYGGASNGTTSSGSGGSGYVLTKDSYKPKGYIPTSEYYFDNFNSIAGGNTTGAYGYAQITLLQALPLLNITSYNSTTATFKADHTDPTLLTKIEYFIDDVLKETITTDLTTEKTINYTLEDNALHTLKIVVTDSSNATAEKVLSISKNIMPLEDDASLQDIASKVSETKEGLINGKTSIINVLALKNIESSLNNTLVELSEKIKFSFDSGDASVGDLMNQLTKANNTISQLNTKYKYASGIVGTTLNTTDTAYLYDTGVYNPNLPQNPSYWLSIKNLNFIPNIFFAECECKLNNPTRFVKYFVFAVCSLPSISSDTDFTITVVLDKPYGNQKYTTSGQVYINNKGNTYMNNEGVYIPAYNPSLSYISYNWHAIKFI